MEALGVHHTLVGLHCQLATLSIALGHAENICIALGHAENTCIVMLETFLC